MEVYNFLKKQGIGTREKTREQEKPAAAEIVRTEAGHTIILRAGSY
jgi:hypothetical protein